MEFEILENSADFKPSDLDEIMISIGWNTEQNAASVPPHVTYRVWRTYDYVAIAKTQGKTVGVLEAFCDRDNFATSYLYCVIVHKDYQRRGIGTALVNAFNKRFAHTTTFVVTPLHKAEGAGEFLQKCGFKDASEHFTVHMRKRNSI